MTYDGASAPLPASGADKVRKRLIIGVAVTAAVIIAAFVVGFFVSGGSGSGNAIGSSGDSADNGDGNLFVLVDPDTDADRGGDGPSGDIPGDAAGNDAQPASTGESGGTGGAASGSPTQTGQADRVTGGSSDFAMPQEGQFSGEVNQRGIASGTSNSDYLARVEIADNASTIAYPSLNCAARLIFEGMDDGEARYREELTEGIGRCDNGGTWWFTSVGYHELQGRYEPQSGRYASTALLFRQTWYRGDDSSDRW